MKNYFLTLVLMLAFASVHAVEPIPGNTAQAGSEANATGGAVYMAPISASPTITVSPLNDVSATNGPIANTATTGPASATANPVATGTANSTASASPIVSPTISPTITGGNATGGNASLQNAGNATLNGSVKGENTLNGTVQGTVNGTNSGVFNNNGSQKTSVDVGPLTNTNDVRNTNANMNNVGVNATGGQGGGGGKGGESSSFSNANSFSKVENSGNSHSTSSVANSGNSQSSSSSSSTGGSVDHVGNVSNAGNSSVVINSPKPLPPAPGVVVPGATPPPLFEQRGLPANAKVELALRFMRACPSTYMKGVELREVREKGSSGLTNMIFTPHSNYVKYSNKGDVQISQVVEIPDHAKVGEHRYLCLGLIQSEALAKEASMVPIQTIVNDAVRFSGNELKGFTKINLVFIPKEALSVNMGLNADGKGFGISPGASGMIGALLGTLAGGFTTNSGYTFPAAQLGGTFIVVAEGNFPETAPHIDFAPPVPVVSIEQKQLDAIRSAQEEAVLNATALREALSQAEAARNIAEAKAAMTEEKMALREALSQAEAARQIAEAKAATQAQPVKVKKVKKVPAKPQCKPCEGK